MVQLFIILLCFISICTNVRHNHTFENGLWIFLQIRRESGNRGALWIILQVSSWDCLGDGKTVKLLKLVAIIHQICGGALSCIHLLQMDECQIKEGYPNTVWQLSGKLNRVLPTIIVAPHTIILSICFQTLVERRFR